MAQKTDLNITPYYDDFDASKNYQKVLFKPGYPVQARELTTLQSVLQNQLEGLSNYIFKNNTVVKSGGISYDANFYAVKLNSKFDNIDVSLYANLLLGKDIAGQTSGSTAEVRFVVLPDGDEVKDLTLYVKYKKSDNNLKFNQFEDGEEISCASAITYGNTTISSGDSLASLVPSDATAIGSAAFIGDSTYYVRGYYVNVPKQTLILDYYTNAPSYRVGLKIDEVLVTSKDDETLNDNAKGFTNYASPGADRLQINLSLTKKLISDTKDTNFIELIRVDNGGLKKVVDKTDLGRIGDRLAERTYEESGHYALDNFGITLHESLNNKLGNDGVFLDTQTTDQGNKPSDDLLSIKVSSGEAYVHGYNYEKLPAIVDLEKPRDTRKVELSNIPFEFGNLIRINNVKGSPEQKKTISLRKKLRSDISPETNTDHNIGEARVYTFNLSGAPYSGNASLWDLYLYDIQIYTRLNITAIPESNEIKESYYVKGKNSGATGYVVRDPSTDAEQYLTLRQVNGLFIVGESLEINGINSDYAVTGITDWSVRDVKSLYQSTAYTTDFIADLFLEKTSLPNGITQGTINSSSKIVSAGKIFTGIREGDIIRYETGNGDIQFNSVSVIGAGSTELTLASIGGAVPGVYDTGVSVGTYNISLASPRLLNTNNASLYAELPEPIISSIDLSGSTLEISHQVTPNITSSTVTIDNDTLGITSSFFQGYDDERYSVIYSDGTIEDLRADQVQIDSNNDLVLNGLNSSGGNSVVNATLSKVGVETKQKKYTRSTAISVTGSKNKSSGSDSSSSFNDGLAYNEYYGMRVQDGEISLNYPDVVKVIAVLESLDTGMPTLDSIQVLDSSVADNALKGEYIESSSTNAVAQVVSVTGSVIDVVYLNDDRFVRGETVIFKESNGKTTLSAVNRGSYQNITESFILDKGQKDQYYDYSKLVRKNNTSIPSRKLKIIFDHYEVPSSDNGDVFTVLSYDKDRFTNDIPTIGPRLVRASDTLDFRPRVTAPFSANDMSPFDFSSRSFNTVPKLILKPKGNCIVAYEHYLPRIDKLYLDLFGNYIVQKGISEINPKEPVNYNPDEMMELSTISFPPYLFNPKEAVLRMKDNKRYTMRDIGDLEDRIENLERVTTLSLLELNTQSLQIRDANGNDRFKSGFFVDDFKNNSLINRSFSTMVVDEGLNELTSFRSENSIKPQITPATFTSDETTDLSIDFDLLDPNVQKTGNVISLKYNSIKWLEQNLATKVQNVNEYNAFLYVGVVQLTPPSDTWTRTERLPNASISTATWIADPSRRGQVIVSSWAGDVLVSSERDTYMRSRNTQFSAYDLKPETQYYQFMSGNGNVDIIPKLLEIANDETLDTYGSIGSFSVGETVVGYDFENNETIRFRVASPSHKEGSFSNPSKKYSLNPYVRTENLTNVTSYTPSSKVLNVDIFSLADQSQPEYYGFIKKIAANSNTKLVGQTSGAVAFVKDLRLVSDIIGDLIGAYFIRDPRGIPTPTTRIENGKVQYKLTNSPTNEKPLPGSTAISHAETTYESTVITRKIQFQTRTHTTYFVDPLAQSFSVGSNIESPNEYQTLSDDSEGIYLVGTDIFFASKSSSAPLRVEIRTMENGKPTRTVIGKPVTLTPDEITTSRTASVATHVKFEPTYLAPGKEYAITLVAETSTDYEVWIARRNEVTIETQDLANTPDAVVYDKQWSIGSLFKSQNGSIWTEDQEEDMKIVLYKAQFTSSEGTAYFHNPTIDATGVNARKLDNNPITTLPKKIVLGIKTETSDELSIGNSITVGRKIAGNLNGYGFIEAIGSPVKSGDGVLTSISSGSNYVPTAQQTNIPTFNIVGNGSGLTVDVTPDDNGEIPTSSTAVVVNTAGSGYKIGDIVGLVTSSLTNKSGSGARITITQIDGIDTLYLTNVQGEVGTGKAFVGDNNEVLKFYNNDGNISSLASTVTTATAEAEPNTGDYILVNHFNHGMYENGISGINSVSLLRVDSSVKATYLTSKLDIDNTSTISVGDTSNFTQFEGKSVTNVGTPHIGYVQIGDEIIGYNEIGQGTLSISGRAVEGKIQPHLINSPVKKYELNGVSLRRINKKHRLSTLNNNIDGYAIKIDMEGRTEDTADHTRLSFNSDETLGGSNVRATENIIYGEIEPQFDVYVPPSTSTTASIRTITGTSIDGTETPFIDKGFENVQIGVRNKLSSLRMITSRDNQNSRLTNIPRNRSLTSAINLKRSSTNENLSPIIYTNTSSINLICSRIDNPISDFASDARVNSIFEDPHSSVYVSNEISLANAATSLKVLLTAYRPENSEIRVLYRLNKENNESNNDGFILFPGYDNLKRTQAGNLTVVDSAKNSGRSDLFVPSSLQNQYLEYEYSIDGLDQFIGFTIKIIFTNKSQSDSPSIRDIRTIALA